MADRARLRSAHELARADPANHGVAIGAHLSVGKVNTFRLVSKPWQRIAEENIDEDFRSGVLAFHGGKGISTSMECCDELEAKRELVKWVIFLLNVTKVGHSACHFTVNLVVATQRTQL
ncbi:hypothetical protein TrLO_g13656 [Triparma laevis f. longispina]|uniref:Uncharacterized protein n=1 Tax=Triparma laevis f. longispina TaxID=1714387 RepID=A0A9W7E3J1_9STRA|nr:hypothetical protein TrLO_g13656 [Triparma laevis f. longispina]